MTDIRLDSDVESPLPADAQILEIVNLPPDPRVNEAIGLQHSIETAIADLLDNSVEHSSKRVWVRFITRDQSLEHILIVDDGAGMDRPKLEDALRLGARREYAPDALGKFGIGLKASAFSQAEVLTVVTHDGSNAPIAMRTLRSGFDGNLSAEVFREQDAVAALISHDVPFAANTGTVVRLSGIRMASKSDDEHVRAAWLDDVVMRVRRHLGLVFHRFIDSERFSFTVDVYDSSLRAAGPEFHPIATDPFRPATGKLGYPRSFLADLPDGVGLPITCHVLLPGAKGPDVSIFGEVRAEWQGIYVYRADRLLRIGGWGDVTKKRSELQLARVLIDITKESEPWFGLNAEKNGVALLPELVRAIQKAGDEDISFEGFLDDARDVLKQANRREHKIRPVAAIGVGLSDTVEAAAGELFGFREFEQSVNVRWMPLRPERVFLLEHERRTIWLNELHRDALSTAAAEPHGVLKTLLFLLLEQHFQPSQLQQTTIDRIEAMQTLIAVALGAQQVNIADLQEEAVATEPAHRLPDLTVIDDDEGPADDRVASPQSEISVPVELDDVDGDYELDEDEDSDADSSAGWSDQDEESDLETPAIDWRTDSVRDYLSLIGRHPLLQAHEEVSLGRRIEAGVLAEERRTKLQQGEHSRREARELAWIVNDGKAAMNQMTASNLRLVVSLAKRYQNHGLELMDLIQEGNTGLVRAVEKFDFQLGYKFSTYATWWIRQAITRALADKGQTIRLPVHMAELGNRIRVARRELSREDFTPSEADIADKIGESVAKVHLFETMTRPMLSLNAPHQYGDWDQPDDLGVDEFGAPTVETVEFGDAIENEFDDIESAIGSQMLSMQLESLLDSLNEREAGVIRMRFGLGDGVPKTLDEIGGVFGVTRERIRQIEAKTLAKLRRPSVLEALGYVAPAVTQDVPDGAAAEADPFDAPIKPVAAIEADLAPISAIESVTVGAADAMERAWSVGDLRRLLRTYRQQRHVRASASAEGFVDRDAALALTRLLLWETGPIDDFVGSPNHGAPWAAEETAAVLQAHRSDEPLDVIAARHGRTQLAIGWRLLDSTAQVVDVPDRYQSEKVLQKAWDDVRRRRDTTREAVSA
jgi:RNA polymerase sigma factor (sigma-70 family)